jgi:uncharacterized iron-regulated membrane protein
MPPVLRRWMFLGHRWLGIGLAVFMLLWFVSGVVMLYVGYPKWTLAERLAALPPLAEPTASLDWPRLATALAGQQPDAIRLTSVAGQPRLIVSGPGKRVRALDWQGQPLPRADAAAALAAAQALFPQSPVREQGLVDEDAWTHSKALDPLRPLYRVQVTHPADTLLYVSAQTGEVVRDASALERNWNWVGAGLHWLYPLRGGLLDAWWADIVITLSLLGCLLSVSGLWIGLLRWRMFGRFPNGSRSPYRPAWMRWHHWLGLGAGLLTLTWVFSGLMSMNPWKMFDSHALKPRTQAMAGASLAQAPFALSPWPGIASLAQQGFLVREVHWRVIAGQGHYQALDGMGRSRLWAAQANAPIRLRLSAAELEHAGQALLPSKVARAEWLSHYDFYYYSRAAHTMGGHQDKPLPVLRLQFADANATWVHLDPYSGTLLNSLDQHGRLKRWLFALLHSWDWLPLLSQRPLWDGVMIAASLGGTGLSLTALVIGWRRLRRRALLGQNTHPARKPA